MTMPTHLRRTYAAAARTYQEYLDRGQLPSEHPWVIHLETRSLCNSTCAFCAAAANNPTRPADALMPDALIDKILAELGAIGYANRLSFYSNNEPFLDKRIFDIVARARKAVPKAYLEIKTNGTTLTFDKVVRIFDAGLDMLYVNDYVTEGEPSKAIEALRAQLSHTQRFRGQSARGKYTSPRLTITTRNVNQVLTSRAGTAPNRLLRVQPLRVPCFRPFEMLTVNPGGLVSVCSDDVYFKAGMGNLNTQSIVEVWTSDKWQEMRRQLVTGNRAAYPETCRDCDSCHAKTEVMIHAGVPLPKRSLYSRLRARLVDRLHGSAAADDFLS
jgi:radical SAM protein with 4Fe4S-binding SPASM domain